MRSRKILQIAAISAAGVISPATFARADPLSADGALTSVFAGDPYGVTDPAVLTYWTPGRMATATPLDARPAAGGRPVAAGRHTAGTVVTPRSAHTWSGSPAVGALFLNDGKGGHYCTASVVRSARKSLILTAAHCLYGVHGWARNIVFVPRYRRGARPYGAWTVGYRYVDARWKARRDPDLDFGFAVVRARHGHRIADVVGANRLVTGQGYTNRVRVIGYPKKKYASADKPIYCDATTHKAFRYQLRFDCRGFYGGTSGSPWLKNYSKKTRRGDVFGVIGGYEEGGHSDRRSYSPVFDKDIARLYKAATRRG